MIVVPKPEAPPFQCCITGRGEDPKGFVWTGNYLPSIDPAIYVSWEGVRLVAKEFGFVEPDVVKDFEAKNQELNQRVTELENELNEASRVVDAIHVIEGKGFKPRKKPGRPPKAPVGGNNGS